ncbi:hypothetical protein [Methylorubrum populi]|uniref:Uncharacterized protein n=1 Tax=Methylorubrum populi TaxID=223967 RepID=A0A833MY71_9HYPH|nr:hypothetical protein [Methylorubrum populi]KAB7785977.1 hypothetical protein F8B43_1378 [Methylorubrum populi]
MPRSQSRPPHPGRTPAERRALDAIGCGDTLPAMHPKVRRNLLDAGLIEQTGTTARRDALGPYEVPQYEMPIPVHMQWCSAVAAADDEMAEFTATDPISA